MIFKSRVIEISSRLIVRLPKEISEKLPSRGMVMIETSIKSLKYQVPLEPDGQRGHWFEIIHEMNQALKLMPGDIIEVIIEVINDWREPKMPQDFMTAIEHENLMEKWRIITPKAKWDWLRFIRSTKVINTRKKRIEVACSKLKKNDKRPCCFNRNICTDMEVCKRGVLNVGDLS